MNFKEFLSQASSISWWAQKPNIVFSGAEFPASFFTSLFAHLKKSNILPAPYQRLNLESIDKKDLGATLHQAPLGMNSFFWLGNVSEIKDAKDLLQKLPDYQGPHHIAFFIKDSAPTAKTRPILKPQETIAIPLNLDMVQVEAVAQVLGVTLDGKKQAVIRKLFTHNSTLNIETSCMLFQYLELISSKYLEENFAFLSNLTGQAPFLNTLSELFFAKQASRFFQLWSTVEKEYPDIFWITFWSEQMWRAHHVINLLHKKDFGGAKRMSFRLPYSFINRDWQKFDTKTLAKGLEFLYHMDYAFKTGSTFCSLDLFYVNHFTVYSQGN